MEQVEHPLSERRVAPRRFVRRAAAALGTTDGNFSPRYDQSEPLRRLISPEDFGWANILPHLTRRLPPEGRFLDVGSGRGVITTLVASQGLEAVGLDGSASAI